MGDNLHFVKDYKTKGKATFTKPIYPYIGVQISKPLCKKEKETVKDMCHELVVKADAIADNILWKVQTKQTVETRTINMIYGS